MFIIDIIILIFLGLGFFIGFKRGFTRELVSLVGIILVTILSFILKNPISVFLYKNLPFFKFDYLIKGASVLNILLYETIAFLIVFSILLIVLKIIMKATSLFEKFLTMTIILSIPSKILGGIVGVIKHYIIIFVVLFITSLPVFSLDIGKTNIGDFIINKTIILSDIENDTLKIYTEFSDLVNKYKDKNNNKEFNQEALDLLIKYKAITKENAKDLIKNGKLKNLSVK